MVWTMGILSVGLNIGNPVCRSGNGGHCHMVWTMGILSVSLNIGTLSAGLDIGKFVCGMDIVGHCLMVWTMRILFVGLNIGNPHYWSVYWKPCPFVRIRKMSVGLDV
jgi:hypothetical protein